jgi:hypothetical protein
MKAAYRVLAMVIVGVTVDAMFVYHAFWQFCCAALVLVGGFVLFGENYK